LSQKLLFRISLIKDSKMKRALFLAALVLYSFSYAQNIELRGVVVEVDGNIPIPGTSVVLLNTDFKATSRSNGAFIIRDIPIGSYTIEVKNFGYSTYRQEISLSESVEFVEISLEESASDLPGVTIVGGSKSAIRKIPGSVYYLSPKDLERFSYTDINRVLRNVPGVNYREEEGFGLRPNIGMRGSGHERTNTITVMEDGVLAAPAPYTAPAAYYFPNVGRMHGVEIMMGPSSIEHGPYTTGGAINFISTPIPDEFSGKMTLLGGRFASRHLHAVVGNSHDNIGYMVETLQFGSDGFKVLDNGGDTGFDRQDFTGKVRFNTNKDAKFYQSLTLKAGHARETSDETYLGITEDDFSATPYRRYAGSAADKMTTSHFQYSAMHNIKFNKNISVTTTAYRNEFTRNWYKLHSVYDSLGNKYSIAGALNNPSGANDVYDYLTGAINSAPGALEVRANNRAYLVHGIQTRVDYELPRIGNIDHKVSASIRYHEDEMDRFQWEDNYTMINGNMSLYEKGVPGSQENRIESAQAIASFVHYQMGFNRFTFTPGLRHELIDLYRIDFGKNDIERLGTDINERSNQVSVFVPGIGTNYSLTEKLDVFAGLHKGFAPPGSLPETKPEESWNYEFGTRYNNRNMQIQVVGFYNDYQNILGSDLAASGAMGTGDLFNAGAARIFGAEVFTTIDILPFLTSKADELNFSLPITLNYTYTNATFQSDSDLDFKEWGEVRVNDIIPYIAPHQLGINVGLEHNKFALNLNARYMGAMRTIPGRGFDVSEEVIKDYIVIDFSASYRVSKNFGVFVNAMNLMNEVYMVGLLPAGYRPGMPFGFNIGVKASF
jgi:Fe(3+) dicitrate transport protein